MRASTHRSLAAPRPNATGDLEMIEHLRELVHAIDKRTWHFERKGEADIAKDAAALRQKALERIAELERMRH